METLNTTLSLGSLDVENGLHLTAIHEAGHVLIGWVFSQKILSVTVKSDGFSDGLTKFAPTPITVELLDFILAAGPAAAATAQTIATGSDAEAAWMLGLEPEEVWEYFAAGTVFGGGRGDHQRSCEMHGGAEEAFDAAMEEARPTLELHWHQVIALAEELVARETLTGAEALAVLDAHEDCV